MGWNGIRGGAAVRPFRWIAIGAVLAALSPAPAGAVFRTPSRFLVDTPTAGTSPVGAFETRTKAFPGGGLEIRVDIGLAHWLTLGGSYGGLQIIGDGEPDWYPEPGFAVKVRVLQESWVLPALALGVDTQGAGYWDDARERYQYQSRGLYAVLSKNYAWYGDLTLHGGVNRTLEGNDENLNPFVGFEKSLGAFWSLALEYDAALNDDRDDGAYGRGRGYLNGAIGWNLSQDMQVRLVVRDMLRNAEPIDPGLADRVVDEGWGREFTFSYVEQF
jgi:hypothetical protein